jgi:uncharacterized protein
MAVFTVSKDHRGEWRWSFAASNHEPIAVSSESYINKSDCIHSMKLVKDQSPTAPAFDMSTDPPKRLP